MGLSEEQATQMVDCSGIVTIIFCNIVRFQILTSGFYQVMRYNLGIHG